MKKQSNLGVFKDAVFKENQILVAILGICSALAVTIQLKLAIIMSLCVMFVTSISSFIISLLRAITPDNCRMLVQLIVISTFVIIIDQVIKAISFEVSKTLSVFIGLIITNCLVMGRSEAFARHQAPLVSFIDGLGAACGYSLVIIALSIIRELFGFGTLLGIEVIPKGLYASSTNPSLFVNLNIMALAPSAFFILGLFIALFNYGRGGKI
jgi:Na+-transporting NADH:ubiquinone oxidoreductase subunit D